MEVSYGILWREDGVEQTGHLRFLDHTLELRPHGDGGATRTFGLEAIEWLEIRPPRNGGRERIVVKLRDGTELELESTVDRWIVHELSRRVLDDAYRPWHPGLGL